MSNTFQVAIADMTQGFRDSMCGVRFIYRLHKEQQQKKSNQSEEPSDEPMTALARRRAERNKQAPDKGIAKKSNEPNVLQRILLCCAWNGGLFWLSILLFNHILMPSLQAVVGFIFGGSSSHNAVWLWIGSLVSWTFGALWILPLFIMSKVVNSIWFQDIADAAYKKTRGRPQMMDSVGKMIADMLFSIVLQGFFLLQGMLASVLPIPGLGHVVYLLHMTLLNSLYSFEYRWFNMGMEVHKRLQHIEVRWPYYVGFGLPLALLTYLPESSIVSGCVFSILFPLFIISGNEAEPAVQPFEFPLRIFSPVIALTNSIFHLSVKSHARTDQSQPASQTTGQSASVKQPGKLK